MIKLLYIFLLFSFSQYPGQDKDGDTFFVDMGVVIKSKDVFDKKIIGRKEPITINTSVTSNVISSLDKIINKVSIIEKDIESKLDALEIENFNLRNQIVSLKQRLNSEILDINTTRISFDKPVVEPPILPEVLHKINDLVEVVEPQSEDVVQKIELSHFDEQIYIKGIVHYSHEEFSKCIETLSALPLEKNDSRNSNKALFILADCYENIGRYRQALICLEKLASLEDPEYSELILFKKGIIFRDMGLVNKAQKAFQTLVNFYPYSDFRKLAEKEIQNI